jgi:hypothetical protein
MMSNEQRLNSLDRFRKQSGRLILEQHDHCEVPAGCGGAVLRWRNPLTARPAVIGTYTPVNAAFALDGEELQTGRVDIAPGRHVLTIVLASVDLATGLLMVVGIDATRFPGNTPEAPEAVGKPFRLITVADGSWKYSLAEPSADWTTVAFDDSKWPALVEIPKDRQQFSKAGSRRAEWCGKQGAVCLGMPWRDRTGEEFGPVWIRRVFEVPVPDAPS